MDWTTALTLPSPQLMIAGGIGLLLCLLLLAQLRQSLHERRHLQSGLAGLALLLVAALSLLAFAAALALQGYRRLRDDTPVATLDARILAPQQWQLTLTQPDGSRQQLMLSGDDFDIEAVIVKWQLPALLAGAPPLYRLDRLSGRYDDVSQEQTAPRTVIALHGGNSWDLFDLKRRYNSWIPGVDTIYGSGAFLPLVEQGHYQIELSATGGLVARPDARTAASIQQGLTN
ncbi:hypothetical protein ACYJW8_07190 [Frateuria aurantia]